MLPFLCLYFNIRLSATAVFEEVLWQIEAADDAFQHDGRHFFSGTVERNGAGALLALNVRMGNHVVATLAAALEKFKTGIAFAEPVDDLAE